MVFSLPSLQKLFDDLQAAVKRFPVASLVALVWVVAFIYGIEMDDLPGSHFPPEVVKLLLMCSLGWPLLLSVQLYTEDRKLPRQKQLIAQFCGVAFLAAYYALLPGNLDDAPSYHLFRYALLTISFVLAVTFGAYLNQEKVLAFWEFNKRLFIQLLIAFVFTGTLYIGLVLTMASFDYLFDVDIDDIRYLELWVVLTGLMATHIIMAGVPSSFSLAQKFTYSTLVKAFARFILMPLIALYTFILLLYAVKILMTGEWPRGQLCYMVLIYAIVGMFTDVLLYPARDEKGHGWVRKTSTTYYALLLPSSLLLFGAIFKRIEQHGLTENRYFVVVLGAWLVALCIYFLRQKAHNIKIIPVSLFCVVLIASFGPWGAFNISKCHQLMRMEAILEQYNMLSSGKIVPVEEDTLSKPDRNALSGIFDYLYKRHGSKPLQPYFVQDITGYEEYQAGEMLMESIGLTYAEPWERRLETTRPRWVTFQVDPDQAISVGRSQYIVRKEYHEKQDFTVQGATFTLTSTPNRDFYSVLQGGDTVAQFNVRQLVQRLNEEYPSGDTHELDSTDLLLRDNGWALQLLSLSFNVDGDSAKEHYGVSAWLLVP